MNQFNFNINQLLEFATVNIKFEIVLLIASFNKSAKLIHNLKIF